MEWLTDALRAPLVELVELVVLAGLAAVTGQLRARQKRARARELAHDRRRELRRSKSSSSTPPRMM
jgi:hypothetical protein